MKLIASCEIPLKVVSESNLQEHWSKKAKRHKTQKLCVKSVLSRHKFTLPCSVHLTRIAPRQLDAHDNLRSAFKWICDCIADLILPGQKAGRADDSKEISWHYFQEKGKPKEYAIKIEIFAGDSKVLQVSD